MQAFIVEWAKGITGRIMEIRCPAGDYMFSTRLERSFPSLRVAGLLCIAAMNPPPDEASTPAERPGTPKDKEYSEFLKTWITPLDDDRKTLREAYESLMSVGNSQDEVPFIVQLAENPKFHLGGLGFFKGRVTLEQHDYIHILLGRGLTLMDEAFVLGFTMGSTDRVSTQESNLFSIINQFLYPKPYRFSNEGAQVFKDAIALAYVSDCVPLESVDFHPLLDLPLREVREAVGLEVDLLKAYFRIEAKRYPQCAASQRLLT